ncbi:MAG: isoprenyl transferase [Pseudomonadota bacterium]
MNARPEPLHQEAGADAQLVDNLPRHVAIIMDGNGRWAKMRSLPRTSGHRQGVEAVRRTVKACLELGIPYLTLFSFSSENWSRPPEEVRFLFNLLRRFIHQDVAELHAAGVRVKVVGNRENLDHDLSALIEESEVLTAGNERMTLVVAFNYGSRDEIVRAVRSLSGKVRTGELHPEDITEDVLDGMIDTAGIPDPEMIVRTSGEKRLSNFLLWQSAYAELVFIDEHWPDFNHELLCKAIGMFQARDRRFGGLSAASAS